MLRNMSKSLLVIISPGFPADESDSACLPLQQALVLALNKAYPEMEIVIMAFHYPFTGKPYRWHNNQVIPLNGRNRGGLHKRLCGIRGWRILKQITRNRKTTGVLSFWVKECAIIGHVLARRQPFKHLAWILGQDAKAGNRQAQSLKNYPEELVALSDFIATEFNKNYHALPAYIVPPGIDPDIFPQGNKEKDIDILAVGSLIPLKQIDTLINVVQKLVPSFPSLKAVICGEGTERNKLLRQIKQHCLEQHIELVGEKKYSEVLLLMQRSKLLIHPSAYEGFGMVCLEALYAGAHVISFCRPQQAWIRHWHYADNEEEMIDISASLLGADKIDHQPVLAYHIKDTAREFIRLFHSK